VKHNENHPKIKDVGMIVSQLQRDDIAGNGQKADWIIYKETVILAIADISGKAHLKIVPVEKFIDDHRLLISCHPI
jgi:hypothetical protein